MRKIFGFNSSFRSTSSSCRRQEYRQQHQASETNGRRFGDRTRIGKCILSVPDITPSCTQATDGRGAYLLLVLPAYISINILLTTISLTLARGRINQSQRTTMLYYKA